MKKFIESTVKRLMVQLHFLIKTNGIKCHFPYIRFDIKLFIKPSFVA